MSSRSSRNRKVYGNSAKRLVDIINKAQTVPSDLSVRDGWATLFQTRADGWSTILSSIAETLDLIEQSRTAILLLDDADEAAPYLDALNIVRNAFTSFNFSAKWSTVIDGLGRTTTTYQHLKALRIITAKFTEEQFLEKDEVLDTIAKIEMLTEQVSLSTLPNDLKLFLIEQLERMRRALRRYQFFGQKALKEDIQFIAGAYLIDERWLSHRELHENDTVKNVLLIVGALAALANIGQGVELVSRLLTG